MLKGNNMDNTLSFAELILKFWNTILEYLWPLYFRHEGFNIIKKTCGKPTKIYENNERFCWKIPFIQTFDIVDMRYQTFNSTAHSFGCNSSHTIPYNIVIDTQIEFRIKDPKVIYELNNDFNNQTNPLYLFVSNQVHLLLSECLLDSKQTDPINLKVLQNTVANKLKNMNEDFCKYIKINRIVITSYDYNISLRQIQ